MNKRLFYLFLLICVYVLIIFTMKWQDAELKLDELTKQINIDVKTKLCETSINNLFTEIELVQLETNEKSVLAGCNKLICYNNKFYIQDQRQNIVVVFNNKGNLIFTTKQLMGNGPNEYSSLTDFEIIKSSGNIQILDAKKQSIFEYDLNGNINKKISLNKKLLPLSKFKPLTNDIYAFYSTSVVLNDKSLRIYSLRRRKVLKKTGFLPVTINHFSKTSIYPFYELNDTVYLNHIFPSNSTFYIDPANFNLMKKYEFDFGKYSFFPEILPENKNASFYGEFIMNNNDRYAFVMSKAENKKKIFIHYFFKQEFYVAIYDKSSQNLKTIHNIRGKHMQLLPPVMLDENYYYYICEPAFIDYVISDQLLDNISREVLSKIHLDNNPIIIKYKFK